MKAAGSIGTLTYWACSSPENIGNSAIFASLNEFATNIAIIFSIYEVG